MPDGRATSNRVRNWATCAFCGGDFGVKKDGTMRVHNIRKGERCPGGGRWPGFIPSRERR